jgi:hypothetical protein
VKKIAISASLAFMLLFNVKSEGVVTQIDLNLVGLAKNLKSLGVQETFIQPGSKTPHCLLRQYELNVWHAVETERITFSPSMSMAVDDACQEDRENFKKRHQLYRVDWTSLPVTPQPPKMKTPAGLFKELPELATPLEGYTWTMPDQQTWALHTVRQTEENAFRIVLSSVSEGYPAQLIRPDPDSAVLGYVPVEVMVSQKYALLLVMLREIKKDAAGNVFYSYHPWVMEWPEAEVLSEEAVQQYLQSTQEFAMDRDPLNQGFHFNHTGYRTYLKLRALHASLPALNQYLKLSSAAGKLYVLAVLKEQYPDAYEQAKMSLKTNAVLRKATVLVVDGNTYEQHSFESVLFGAPEGVKKPSAIRGRSTLYP